MSGVVQAVSKAMVHQRFRGGFGPETRRLMSGRCRCFIVFVPGRRVVGSQDFGSESKTTEGTK